MKKYGGFLIVLSCFWFSPNAYAELERAPELDEKYQTELPTPPAFPKHFRNVEMDNEKAKSIDDEDRERYEPKKNQVGERITQESGWATDFEIDLSDWDMDESGDWDFNGELIAIVILGVLGTILLIFLVLFLMRLKFKGKRKEVVGETENIITHLEILTKNQSHEKLAISGDFNIAVHALLLEVIRVIFRLEPDLDRPSVTAREIGSTFTRPEVVKDLEPLIQVVEWSLFAERPATQEHYQDLLPRSERLISHFEERLWRKGNLEETEL